MWCTLIPKHKALIKDKTAAKTVEFLHREALHLLPEHGLDVDDGLGVCHVVFLSTHGALLVHNHQVVGVDYATLQQVVQASAFRKQRLLHLNVSEYTESIQYAQLLYL